MPIANTCGSFRICVVNVWFGEAFPTLFPLGLKTVAANDDMVFLMIGNLPPQGELPSIFRHYFMTKKRRQFEEVTPCR